MSAVSGSPTQVSTSVATLGDLGGVPDDGFEDGDLAYVRSSRPVATYQLHRSGNPPPESIPAFSGNGYWAPLSTSSTAIVFRPGLPSEGIHVETWEEVERTVRATEGAITLYIDSSNAPAQVPSGTTLDGRGLLVLSSSLDSPGSYNTLTLLGDAQLKNLAEIRSTLRVEGTPTTRNMLEWDPPHRIALVRDGATVALLPGATIPVFTTSDTFELVMDYGSRFDDGATGLAFVRSTSFIILIVTNCFDPSTLANNLAEAAFGLIYLSDATGPRPGPSFLTPSLGVVFTQLIDQAISIEPLSGPTLGRPAPASPNIRVGMMYFDTDLGIPVWWTGATWVNASGVPS